MPIRSTFMPMHTFCSMTKIYKLFNLKEVQFTSTEDSTLTQWSNNSSRRYLKKQLIMTHYTTRICTFTYNEGYKTN